jgi:hypothetical protein
MNMSWCLSGGSWGSRETRRERERDGRASPTADTRGQWWAAVLGGGWGMGGMQLGLGVGRSTVGHLFSNSMNQAWAILHSCP